MGKEIAYKLFGLSSLAMLALISEQAIFPKPNTNKKNLQRIIEKSPTNQEFTKFTNQSDDLKSYNSKDTIKIYDGNYLLKESNGIPVLMKYSPQENFKHYHK